VRPERRRSGRCARRCAGRAGTLPAAPAAGDAALQPALAPAAGNDAPRPDRRSAAGIAAPLPPAPAGGTAAAAAPTPPTPPRPPRWFRLVERWLYRHRPRAEAGTMVREPGVADGGGGFEPTVQTLRHLLPGVATNVLDHLVHRSERHRNGRCNTTATATAIGL